MRDALALRVALPLAALVLAGCATSMPDASSRPALSAAALPALAPSPSAQPGAFSIERWWTTFADPALDRLIDEALERNLDLVAAAARVREARARLDEVHGARLPRLDLQAQSGRGRQSADGLPAGTSLLGSNHAVSLVARHEVDLWGRLGASDEAARQRLLAEEWARSSIAWSLSAQLA